MIHPAIVGIFDQVISKYTTIIIKLSFYRWLTFKYIKLYLTESFYRFKNGFYPKLRSYAENLLAKEFEVAGLVNDFELANEYILLSETIFLRLPLD